MPETVASRPAQVREEEVPGSAALDALLAQSETPFVVRGIATHWPLVIEGRKSAREARAYLLARARNREFTVSMADPSEGGRLFYDEAMQVNFRMGTGRLPDIFAGFDKAEGAEEGQVPTVYLGSIDVQHFFEGLHEANHIPLSGRDAMASIWIGNATRIAAHNDFPDNLAVCAVGRRRFTLFPPEQFQNLYLGPIDITPAGRPISMVDFAEPDLARHPRFAQALDAAQVVELEPGDALFIPTNWYHHVEGLAPFNVLVNYWWRDTPRFLGQPQNALHHAILAIRDLPEAERATWRALFEHYVFSGGEAARAHVPEAGRGVLAPLDAAAARRMHAFLLRSLNQ